MVYLLLFIEVYCYINCKFLFISYLIFSIVAIVLLLSNDFYKCVILIFGSSFYWKWKSVLMLGLVTLNKHRQMLWYVMHYVSYYVANVNTVSIQQRKKKSWLCWCEKYILTAICSFLLCSIKDTLNVPDDHIFGILFKPDEYGAGDLIHNRGPGTYLRGKDHQRGVLAAVRQHLKKMNYHNFSDLLAAFKHYDKASGTACRIDCVCMGHEYIL